MSRKIAPPVLLLLLLAGCATGPSLQSRMAAYIGADEQTLVEKFGVPDKQITVNGVQYLAYAQHHEELEPNDLLIGDEYPEFYGPFFTSGIFGAGLPQQIEDYSCETTFMLKRGRVYDFSLRGNDCG